MKRETAFRALRNRRHNETMDRMRYCVVSINKNGKPSKVRDDECKARTMDEAEKILARMEKLNPNSNFTIVEL